MSDINTLKAEKEDLELHVDLCAQRYSFLESKLKTLEVKFDALEELINKNKNSLTTVIITSTGTMVTALIGVITTILMKF